MSKFYRNSSEYTEIDENDHGISVQTVIKLIEKSEFKSEVLTLFKISQNSKDIIPISGLKQLINTIIHKDEEFKKIDLNLNLSDVSLKDFTETESAILEIQLTQEQQIIVENDVDSLLAETIYNSKSDYFDSAYKLDAFSKFCAKEKHIKLLRDNISHLNEYYQNSNDFNRSFRLLKNKDGAFYLRAITSTTHYNNYDNRFSLFIAIVSLWNVTTSKGWQFKVNRYEYDESVMKVYFEKVGNVIVKGVGNVKFLIEVSNDEIKREAMKFSTIYYVTGNDYDLYLAPGRLKTDLASIKHSFKPTTVFSYLKDLGDTIKSFEEETVKDFNAISSIKKADELRHLLLKAIETTKNTDIKDNKAKLSIILNTRINTIAELLKLMSKVDIIVSNLETKEYLRYLYYDILYRKK